MIFILNFNTKFKNLEELSIDMELKFGPIREGLWIGDLFVLKGILIVLNSNYIKLNFKKNYYLIWYENLLWQKILIYFI